MAPATISDPPVNDHMLYPTDSTAGARQHEWKTLAVIRNAESILLLTIRNNKYVINSPENGQKQTFLLRNNALQTTHDPDQNRPLIIALR
ncbi:hypothetical protein [Komagataeibacter oboediens]|uniref:hypothetical protein n=1 Tax=Komagataeibacter oboediens TaxID=65958 RepID=UPI001C2DEE1D|nr:hypothetical protein [Komagataeibacter oboediens]